MTRGRRGQPWLTALAGYTSLTLVSTWPLAIHLATVVPHDLGDPLLCTWILWWNAHTMPLTSAWWNAPMFWPMPGALAVSEHLLGVSLVASPLQWLGADPVAAYNILFLLSFPLCAMAAHALAHTVTNRHDASAIAGVAFGFNPYRISQIAHPQMMWVFWMPLALLALHRYARDGRLRWLMLFAAMWIGQALSNSYFLLFFPLLIALWLAWFLAARRAVGRLAAVAVAWGTGSLLMLPLLVPYQRFHEQLGLSRTVEEVRMYSADVTALAATSPMVHAASVLPAAGNPEQQLFPGVTVPLLILAGIAVSVSFAARTPTPRHRLSVAFAIIAAGALAFVLSVRLVGGWRLGIGALTILSVTTATKPFTMAIWFGVLAMATGSVFERARSTRSALAFYVCAAAVMYAFSFGPVPAFSGVPFWYKPPYEWLMHLPGFTDVRAPARFAMLAELCLSVAAAIALTTICAQLPRRLAAAAAALAIAGAVADGWIRELPLPSVPPRLAALESTRDGAVVELPVGDVYDDIAALYRSMYHRRPAVNGYGGFEPTYYAILRVALEADEMEVIDELRRRDAMTVVGAGRRISTFPRLDHAGAAPSGHRLRVHAVMVDGVPIESAPITDGNRLSRWDSGSPQSGTETMMLDMGSVHTIDGVTLTLGSDVGSFPRSLAIDTSEDLRTWHPRWHGRGAGRALAGVLDDPRSVPLTFGFEPGPARWIRLRQLGTDARFHWAIADVTVSGR